MTTSARPDVRARLRSYAEARGDAEALAELAELIAIATPAAAPGQRKPSTTAAFAERDEILRRAARVHWLGAEELAAAMERYFATAWLREKAEPCCPARHAGKVEAALWQALKLRPWPIKARQLRAILAVSDELAAETLRDQRLNPTLQK